MKSAMFVAVAGLAFVAGSVAVQAQSPLVYTFNSDVEGFQNVIHVSGPAGWADAPSIMQNHTSGGWQMLLTKEFSYVAGGGAANQQLAMQLLANSGNGHLAFDVSVDGNSFPAGAAGWFQFGVVGNSDGAAGWTQNADIFTAATYHNADDPALISMHFDFTFAGLGWEPGDTWFQLYTGSNSDGAFPVNFYIDNVIAYAVPEPSTFALAGLGAVTLLVRRRK